MSLLDELNFIEIKLYYKFLNVNGAKKLVIIPEDKIEKILGDPEKMKGIESISTQWSVLTWKEQNEVAELASKRNSPNGEKQFNFLVYRDSIIKKCLKQWDLTVNDRPVPVSGESIDKLPGPVVIELYQRYEKILDYTEEEIKN